MNVIEIPETGKRIEYPSTWEECTPSQVQYIFREADRLLTGDIDPLEFIILLVSSIRKSISIKNDY